MITLSTHMAIPETVLSREIDGEAVLLELSKGIYYGLNQTGTRMWGLLREHGQVEPVFRALLAEYEVDEDLLLKELLSFISTLTARGLLVLNEP